jgi:hypothetical protein
MIINIDDVIIFSKFYNKIWFKRRDVYEC